MRKAEVEVYMGCCWTTLEDEGLLRGSAADIVQISEPLYLMGLAILLMAMLMGPVEFKVIVEEVRLRVYEDMIDGDAGVTVVLEVITISLGRETMTMRLSAGSM